MTSPKRLACLTASSIVILSALAEIVVVVCLLVTGVRTVKTIKLGELIPPEE
jgi:hypothetical protein